MERFRHGVPGPNTILIIFGCLLGFGHELLIRSNHKYSSRHGGTRDPGFPSSSLFLGRALSGVITVLEDRGYMVTVREKINNIKRVGEFYDFPMPYQPK